MSIELSAIKVRIAQIQEKYNVGTGDSTCLPFGFSYHKLVLNSPVSSIEMASFESRFRVVLPDDYRTYLLEIGNGGLGPGCGIFTLEQAVSYNRHQIPSDILLKPFPHVHLFEPIYWDDLECQLAAGKLTEQQLDQIYLYEASGTLVLSHEGSGHLHRLVVSGPSKGKVWIDSTCSDQGYIPLGVSFEEWFAKWLESIEEGGNGVWWLSNL